MAPKGNKNKKSEQTNPEYIEKRKRNNEVIFLLSDKKYTDSMRSYFRQ